jgi:sugar O-acyltransferase (sialic acid O-acetyltransferase NeuD family)
MNRPAIILGAGGHASVVVDILRAVNYPIEGIVSVDKPKNDPVFKEYKVFPENQSIYELCCEKFVLVNGLGIIPGKSRRESLQIELSGAGFKFLSVISPNSHVSEFASLDEGVHVFPGAVVNAGAQISGGTIVNSGAVIEHDCRIGEYNHIAPGAVICGGVRTGRLVHVGAGATVIQGLKIGDVSVVGAGATLTHDMGDHQTLYAAKTFLSEN